jgi:hypothetical protein
VIRPSAGRRPVGGRTVNSGLGQDAQVRTVDARGVFEERLTARGLRVRELDASTGVEVLTAGVNSRGVGAKTPTNLTGRFDQHGFRGRRSGRLDA